MLKIDKQGEAGKVCFALEGRLDTLTAPELEKMLNAALPQITDLVIDMEKLEYMSSAGLRLLLDAAQTIEDHGTMKVIHISPVIMNILRVTGFADLFTIE